MAAGFVLFGQPAVHLPPVSMGTGEPGDGVQVNSLNREKESLEKCVAEARKLEVLCRFVL